MEIEMRMIAHAISRVFLFALALAILALPAVATITYTSCTSGCSSSSGTYAVWQSAPGSAGLTFSMSPATFAAGNLVSGVYTDGSGTIITGYNGASIDTLTSVSGTSLLEGVNGTGTGFEIQLPANTYAFAMSITTLSGFGSPGVELGDHIASNANYGIIIPSGGSVQFFAITSDTPLPMLFVGPSGGSGGRLQINDFEIGQASETPEGSSATLIGGGLVLLGLLRRRRVHKPDNTVV